MGTQGCEAPVDMSTREASFREVARMAAPIIVSMLSMSILGLVDTWFMRFVGAGAQAAVGIGGPTIFSLLSLFLGTLSGLTTFVSQYFGAKKYHDCGVILWHILPIALFLGVACAFFINPLVWFCLETMKVNPEFIQETYDYLKVRIWAAPCVFISFSLLSFLRGLGNMRIPAIVSTSAVILNIPLTYIFTFGCFGIPAFGVMGAAIGTAIAQCVEMICYGFAVFGRKYHKMFLTRQIVRPRLVTYKNYFKLSVPIGVSWALEHLGWIVFGFYIGTLSKAEAAANAIVQSFLNMAFMPGLAISIAATSLVGQYIGAKNIKNAEKTAYYSMYMAIVCLVTLGIVFLLLRHIIAESFSTEADVIVITANLFIVGAFYQVFDAMGVTMAGALRGAGDTRFPMVIQILSIWIVMVPLVFWWGGIWGVFGAWYAASAAIMVMGIFYLVRFRSGKWKNMGIAQSG